MFLFLLLFFLTKFDNSYSMYDSFNFEMDFEKLSSKYIIDFRISNIFMSLESFRNANVFEII